MRIEKCSFCGMPVYPGHGQIFIRNDCRLFRYCSSKCRKNFGMKRNPLKLKWTQLYRRANNKQLTVDKSLEFEKIRNIPIKYHRELVHHSIRVIKRVDAIRSNRHKDLWLKRMSQTNKQRCLTNMNALKHNIDWIQDQTQKERAIDDYNRIKGKVTESKRKKREVIQKKKAKNKQAMLENK